MSDPTCRSCRAPVIFVPSAKSGKRMILDATPKKGVVIFVGESTEAVVLATKSDLGLYPYDLQAHVVDVYSDHHGTCPNAKSWAGKNRKDPPAPLRDLPAAPLQLQDGPTRGHAGR